MQHALKAYVTTLNILGIFLHISIVANIIFFSLINSANGYISGAKTKSGCLLFCFQALAES